jgi:hypothetical protein
MRIVLLKITDLSMANEAARSRDYEKWEWLAMNLRQSSTCTSAVVATNMFCI